VCEQSRAVHGLCDADLEGAPFLEQVADALAASLDRAAWIAGYNAGGFDLPVLALAAERAAKGASSREGAESLGRLRDAARRALRRCLDPSAMLRDREPRKLADALGRAGARIGDRAHEAGADTLAALLALWRESHRWHGPADAAGCVEGANFLDVKRQFEVVGDEALAEHRAGRPPAASAVVLRFGKHRDRTLADLARDEPGYLDWILDADFERAAVDAVRRAAAAERMRGQRARLGDPAADPIIRGGSA
jgi:DNA polymerase III subunit epsilon